MMWKNMTLRSLKQVRIWLALALALAAPSALAQYEPQNVKVDAMCEDRVSIKWKPSSGADGYRIVLLEDGEERTICETGDSDCMLDSPGSKGGEFFIDKKTESGYELSQDSFQLPAANREACPSGGTPIAATPRPPVDTCPNLPAGIAVRGHSPFSTQCQQVSEASVGNADLMARGIIDAVDVWGNVEAEVEVCFNQPGKLYFLDAATSPRSQSELPAERIDGMTCGRIKRVGTVALISAGDAASESQPEAPASADQPDEPPALFVPPGEAPYICQLVAGDIINLRSDSGTEAMVLAEIPTFSLLVPQNRTKDWFQVTFDGQLGWVSKEYVFQSVGCNAFNAAGNAPPPEAQAEAAPDRDQAEAAPSIEAAPSCTLRSGDIINLRQGPGLDYAVLLEIPNQTVLPASERSGDWLKVDYGAETGWVHIDYVFREGACG